MTEQPKKIEGLALRVRSVLGEGPPPWPTDLPCGHTRPLSECSHCMEYAELQASPLLEEKDVPPDLG